MDSSEQFSALESRITAALVAATRITNQICAEDVSFHRSLDPRIGTQIDRQNARLLSLADRLLSSAAASSDAVGHHDTQRSLLPDADALDGNWRGVVDVLDSLLERADTSLDEFTGVVKRGAGMPNKDPQALAATSKSSRNLYRTQDDLPKPQLLFEHTPQNHKTSAFRPLLTSKPHAVVSLEESSMPFQDGNGESQYRNPYQKEIERYQFPQRMYAKSEPIPYQPFESTSATLVDTPEALEKMLAELKSASEIAIDLEHHDARSYIGIVSLMQISTRNKDWIVDTLKPWRRRLQCLNEVFTDPSIIKVLHGAYMDIVWLQRDFGLYIVGLFDTHHAARALQYSGGSLAFLLQKFVNFSAQKQYQMADWRIRPLPKELFEYARADTHFLLYIFDNMRNELIDKSKLDKSEQDLIHTVLVKSKEECLQRYETQIYDASHGMGAGGWYKLLLKTPALLSKEQFSVLRAVHEWRDSIARAQDDSTVHIMSQHQLFNIARTMPSDKATLFSVAQPMSQTLRLRADELVAIIAAAKAAGVNGPDMADLFTRSSTDRDVASRPVAAKKSHVAPAPTVAELGTTPLRIPTVVDAPNVRSQLSTFWGRVFSMGQARSLVTDRVRLRLALPQLTTQIFADPKDGTAEMSPLSTPAAPLVSTPQSTVKEQEDVFIIKQLAGRKRKAPSTSVEGIALNEDEVAISGLEEQPVGNKSKDRAARKAEKRAARKLREEQSRGTGGEAGNGADETPLDYENAPSILHAPRDKAEKVRPPIFDPFKKATDTPKGLGRGQKERVGRSGTFSR